MSLEQTQFKLGGVVVQPTQNRIDAKHGATEVEPRHMAVLVYLAGRPGEVVTSDEIITAVWGDNFHGENPLYRTISKLREALGDDKQNPTFIQTVARRGYRLLAEPEVEDASKPVSSWVLIAAATAILAAAVVLFRLASAPEPPPTPTASPSIAVLPFVTSRGSESQEFLADGLAEELLILLRRLERVNVAARGASFYYKDKDVPPVEIARSLQVRYILEGSIQKSGNVVRVFSHLTDSQTGLDTWSQRYERTAEDLFSLQTDIASKVAGALKLVLGRPGQQVLDRPPTQDSAAYDYYLRGLAYLRGPREKDRLDNAVSLFNRAIAEDTTYAQAHAGLCQALLALYATEQSTRDFELAERSCHRAQTLDANLIEARISLGVLYRESGQYTKAQNTLRAVTSANPRNVDAVIELGDSYLAAEQLEEAGRHYRRAVELQPAYYTAQSALGAFYFRQRDFSKAAEHFLRVTELTPDSSRASSNYASALYMLEDFDGAVAAWRRSIELKPSRLALTNVGLHHYYKGEFIQAAELQRRAAEIAPNDFRVWGRLAESLRHAGGREQEAREAYRQGLHAADDRLAVNPADWEAPMQQANFHTFLGNLDKVAPLLEKAHALSPDNAEIYYVQAIAATASQDSDGALAALRTAVDLGYAPHLILRDPDIKRLADDPILRKFLTALQQ